MLRFCFDHEFDNLAYAAIQSGEDMLVVINPARTKSLPPWLRETLLNHLTGCPLPDNVIRLDDYRTWPNAVAFGLPIYTEVATQLLTTT